MLIKQCAGMLQSENTIPKHLRREFLEQFPEFRTGVFTVDAFFPPQVYSVFPTFQCASFGACDFLI